MISVNILNDQKPGREMIRTISFLSIFSKSRIAVSEKMAEFNVFGGYQTIPGARHVVQGDIGRRENLTRLVRYVTRTYQPDDLAVILENDVIPCVGFLWYIKKAESVCPRPNCLRSGYSTLPRMVSHYRQAIKDRSWRWVPVLNRNWFCGPCVWMTVRMWRGFLGYLESYKTERFQLDAVLRDWQVATKRFMVSILVPNVVYHIGRVSAVYPESSLRGESREHTFPKQSFAYLENPFAFGGDPWKL